MGRIKGLRNKVFCIIKYKVESLGECHWVWACVTTPFSIFDCSRDEAFRIIDEFGLELKLENDDGLVYDTKDFRYRNTYSKKRLRRR